MKVSEQKMNNNEGSKINHVVLIILALSAAMAGITVMGAILLDMLLF